MATVEKIFKRSWLNEDEGTAYVVIDAERCDDSKYIDARIEIKDCTRQIQLDFYYSDEEGRAEKLAKIDNFIAHLSELRDFIDRNHPPTQKEVDAVRKKNKSKKTKVEIIDLEI